MSINIVKKGGKITMVGRKLAADTKMVVNDVLTAEDEFRGLYWSDKNAKNVVLEPPFAPRTLAALCFRNNTLLQCISAMEVNVDGTGHDIVPLDETAEQKQKVEQALAIRGKRKPGEQVGEPKPGEKPGETPAKPQNQPVQKAFPPAKPVAKPGEDKPDPFAPDPNKPTQEELDALEEHPEKRKLESFFKEPFPEQSFVTQRRLLRWDIEVTGNGYLEVLRNMAGEVTMTRWLDATTLRLVKFDAPIQVEKTVERDGQEFKATVWMRERRFAQVAGSGTQQQLIYFKEFGASRELNRNTGEWTKEVLEPTLRASEIIHFTAEHDPVTSYGVPRWINQLPSVLGSRKSEEFNLEFFDAGGMPPAIFFILGGALVGDAAEQLRSYLSGNAKSKHRAAIVEVQSTTGSLDVAGTVNVKTERFGDTKTQDSMFQQYDQNTEAHVRGAFRIPPIFLGKAEDYNFATAMTSVMVTEEQVFKPEREEFDEIVNKKIVRALGVKEYLFKSQAMTLKNVDSQLAGLELVKDSVSGEDLVTSVNEATGLSLSFDQVKADQVAAQEQQMHEANVGLTNANAESKINPPGIGAGAGGAKPQPGKRPNAFGGKPFPTKKEDVSPTDILALASRWSQAVGLEDGTSPMTSTEKLLVVKMVEELDDDQRVLFDGMLSRMMFSRSSLDSDGLAEIAGCVSQIMH